MLTKNYLVPWREIQKALDTFPYGDKQHFVQRVADTTGKKWGHTQVVLSKARRSEQPIPTIEILLAALYEAGYKVAIYSDNASKDVHKLPDVTTDRKFGSLLLSQIVDRRRQGATLQDIAVSAGVSRQRIAVVLNKLKNEKKNG